MKKIADNKILVDLDTKDEETISRMLWALACIIKVDKIKIDDVDVKETRKGYHILLKLKEPISKARIILYQLLLGSDTSREMYNYMRLRRNAKDYNIFFIAKISKDGISKERTTIMSMIIKHQIKEVIKSAEIWK